MVELEWRRLRADQLREKARQDTIVIVPIGSLEQHGPHCPVEVDSRLVETVAMETASRLCDRESVLVLPTVWTGVSEHHMSFGGTVSLGYDAFAAVIDGICASLVRHGFKRIVLFNGHGGNDNALRVITDELTPKYGVPITQFTYWHAASEPIEEILETQQKLRHACEAETSMMMAVRPELIAEDRIPLAKSNAQPSVEDLVGGGVYRWRSLGAMAASGVIGNPEAATPEKGKRLIADIGQVLADKLANKEFWELTIQSDVVEP
ncbi:hypothetical protein ATO13_21096 [Stappia sp. 22II-S9-Z10]|nr:hypothetical protein ATO13_21096 [Stappia sp. 22II-S9-Z10]